jgi:hypothetical protein
LGDARVSRLAIGAVSEWRTIPAAFEAGINLFFVSSDFHWPIYARLREGLNRLLESPRARQEVVLMVTSYIADPRFVGAALDEVVMAVPAARKTRLVLCAGGLMAQDSEARLRSTRSLAQEQKALGVAGTFHDRVQALRALTTRAVELGLVRYNPLHPRAKADLFPFVTTDHPPLFGFNSTRGFMGRNGRKRLGLGRGVWMPKVTDHYRFALCAGALSGLLCSPPTPAAVQELLDAIAAGPLDEDEEEHMMALAVRAALKGVKSAI